MTARDIHSQTTVNLTDRLFTTQGSAQERLVPATARVSPNGVVYFASSQDLQNHYAYLTSREDAPSVQAFYDPKTKYIYAFDLNTREASTEARLLQGAILRHEVTHRTTMSEEAAFHAMYEYIKRYNEHAQQCNKPVYQLNLSERNISISAVPHGQSPHYASAEEIKTFVNSVYGEVLPLERIAALQLEARQASEEWRQAFKEAIENIHKISDFSVRGEIGKMLAINNPPKALQVLEAYERKVEHDLEQSQYAANAYVAIAMAQELYTKQNYLGEPLIPHEYKQATISEEEFDRLSRIALQIVPLEDEQAGGLGIKIGKFFNPIWGVCECSGKVCHGFRLDPAHTGGIAEHGLGGDRPHIDISWKANQGIKDKKNAHAYASYKVFTDDLGNTIIRKLEWHESPPPDKKEIMNKGSEPDRIWIIPPRTEVKITVNQHTGMITVQRATGGPIPATIMRGQNFP